MVAAKRVVRYLRSTATTQLVLCFNFPDEPSSKSSAVSISLQSWFDTSWADDPDDRRSTFDYTLIYGNSALLWKSKKHRATTLSTTDPEYVAATDITRELCFVRNIFDELGISFLTLVPLYGDNINATSLANSMYYFFSSGPTLVCCSFTFVGL